MRDAEDAVCFLTVYLSLKIYITQSDALIHQEAGLRMTALGQMQDQKQDDVYRVSQAARTLGRIVLLARQSKPGVGLDDIIQIN